MKPYNDEEFNKLIKELESIIGQDTAEPNTINGIISLTNKEVISLLQTNFLGSDMNEFLQNWEENQKMLNTQINKIQEILAYAKNKGQMYTAKQEEIAKIKSNMTGIKIKTE